MLCSEHCLPSRILVSESEMMILLLGLTLQWRTDGPTHRVPHCTCLSDSSVPRGLPDNAALRFLLPKPDFKKPVTVRMFLP